MLKWLFRKRKQKKSPQFSGLFTCHQCKANVLFSVNQYDRATQQAVYCDRCGKTNSITVPAIESKEMEKIQL